MQTWVVPGAPLERGRGWRIWYSWPDDASFRPAPVTVRSGAGQVAIRPSWPDLGDHWVAFDPVPHLGRGMGVLMVELDEPVPGGTFDVDVPEAGRRFRWRTLPRDLSSGETFLFASCFWEPNDKEGAYSAAVRELVKLVRPAFKLLIGDQVYQDYPFNWFEPLSSFRLFAKRYEEYWSGDAYRQVLGACPNYFVCDDHEFWNDFPEPQRHLPRTWRAGEREEMERVARLLFHRYQQGANPDQRAWFSFDIGATASTATTTETPPVSFFLTDARSERERWTSDAHFFGPQQWDALEAWARGLQGPGVLVLGQPLFQKDGDWKDHSLSNFQTDYGRLCAVFEDVLRGDRGTGPHDILILTGDIHNARFSVGTIRGMTGIAEVSELVASPASRVGPFFRHPKPQEVPAKFAIHRPDGRRRVWEVVLPASDQVPSIDNNVGVVRMSPGTNGRVRFELEIWKIRPYAGTYWRRILHWGQPSGSLRRLYRRELLLR